MKQGRRFAHDGAEDAASHEVDPALRQAIERTIFELLAMRADTSTICPSDVARTLAPDDGRWRALMPPIRQVAQDLARNQRLRVTRGGVPVDATSAGGPIRLGRAAKRTDG